MPGSLSCRGSSSKRWRDIPKRSLKGNTGTRSTQTTTGYTTALTTSCTSKASECRRFKKKCTVYETKFKSTMVSLIRASNTPNQANREIAYDPLHECLPSHIHCVDRCSGLAVADLVPRQVP